MKKGTVKWYNSTKGFGFIADEENDRDVFVHSSGIVTGGFQTLKEGQPVTFDIIETEKGPEAVHVTVV